MIHHDPYAGHRKWWDSEWKPDETSRDWTEWDYILADVFQVIEDFTDSNGQWMPYDQSGSVYWTVHSKFSGHDAEIERHREHNEPKPGETWYAVPTFADPDNPPTIASWLADMEEGVSDLRPQDRREARPPTAEELALARAEMKARENAVE